MYEELIKDLREWPRACAEYAGSLDELHDKAADAIEELSKPQWIKFEKRELDQEEKEEHPEWCYILEGQTPDDGQEIFASDGRWVWADVYYNDDGCYLDSDRDLEGLWWMPFPKPPEEGTK